MFKLLNKLKFNYNRDLFRIGYRAREIHRARHASDDRVGKVSRTTMFCAVVMEHKAVEKMVFDEYGASFHDLRSLIGLNEYVPSNPDVEDMPDFDISSGLREGIREYKQDFPDGNEFDSWRLCYACLSGKPGRLVNYLAKVGIDGQHARKILRDRLDSSIGTQADSPIESMELVGRDTFLAELDEAFDNPDTRVVSVVGHWGLGKTSLVHIWTNRLVDHNEVTIHWLSVWQRHDLPDLKKYLLSILEHPREPDEEVPSDETFFERLSEILQRSGRHVLVVDDIDRLTPKSSISLLFLNQLVETYKVFGLHNLCVLIGVEDYFDTSEGVGFQSVVLAPLTEDDGITYLRILGVQGSDRALSQVVRATKGVPRTLGQVGQRIVQDFEGDPDRLPVAILETILDEASMDAAEGADREYVHLIANFNADVVDPDHHVADRLGIDDEVNALCSIIAAKMARPPLAIGLFGDWGAGKSFFMNMMRQRIRTIASNARKWKSDKVESAYCSDVIQITFNAWHYVDTNLWASLVTHIFEQMALQLTEEDDTRSAEETRRKLFENVETAKELMRDAMAQKALVEEEVNEAKERLKAVENREAELGHALQELKTTRLLDTALSHDIVSQLLRSAGDKLGVQMSGIDEIRSTANEVRTFAGRLIHVIQRTGHGDNKRRLFLVSLFIGIPVIASAAAYWLSNGFNINSDIQRIAVVTTGAFTLCVQWAAWLRPQLKVLSEGMRRYEEADDRLNELIVEEHERRALARFELQQELVGLRKKQDENRERLRAAEKRLNDAEEEIKEISIGRRLYVLLGELGSREEYRGHLGLISTIRRDFKALSELLIESAKSEVAESLPRVDRIVLYIDDLDRCPSSKVVEVLQAVHLMMAFELFVVVVGVDARWLLHSLQDEYQAFGPLNDASCNPIEREWRTTPQDYLEKIFQIPFAVGQMKEEGYQQLMGTLLPINVEQLRQVNQEANVAALEQEERIRKSGQTDEAELRDDGPNYLKENGDFGDGEASTEIPPNPEQLRVRSWELAYIKGLSAFVHSPRAAKRFANIYSLVRAMVPNDELGRFEGTEQVSGEYQVVALLLAILSGYPEEAHEVFRYLLTDADGEQGWWEFVEELRPVPLDESAEGEEVARDSVVYQNVVSQNIGRYAAVRWSQLSNALEEQRKATRLPDSLEPFIRLTGRVARFSFKSGRAIPMV